MWIGSLRVEGRIDYSASLCYLNISYTLYNSGASIIDLGCVLLQWQGFCLRFSYNKLHKYHFSTLDLELTFIIYAFKLRRCTRISLQFILSRKARINYLLKGCEPPTSSLDRMFIILSIYTALLPKKLM